MPRRAQPAPKRRSPQSFSHPSVHHTAEPARRPIAPTRRAGTWHACLAPVSGTGARDGHSGRCSP
jgi:hypothetical protein